MVEYYLFMGLLTFALLLWAVLAFRDEDSEPRQGR